MTYLVVAIAYAVISSILTVYVDDILGVQHIGKDFNVRLSLTLRSLLGAGIVAVLCRLL